VKLPYGYVLAGKEITAHEEKTDAVRGIFKYYLAGASLGKIVNMLFAKGLLNRSFQIDQGRYGKASR
jgi:ribosomal protein L35AE/L33A